MLMISEVSDSGTVTELILSPVLIPTCAGVPPNPFSPPAESPVVHCISPFAYRNMANEVVRFVARTHWNVFVWAEKYTFLKLN